MGDQSWTFVQGSNPLTCEPCLLIPYALGELVTAHGFELTDRKASCWAAHHYPASVFHNFRQCLRLGDPIRCLNECRMPLQNLLVLIHLDDSFPQSLGVIP